MCSVTNQALARDVHLLCVACINYPTCARQHHVQQCMHKPVFEVLHAVNLQAHMCASTRV